MKKNLLISMAFLAILCISCEKDVNDYLADENVKTYDYTTEELWTQHGENRIYGVLYTPQGVQGKMPVCIMSHGFNGSHKNSHGYTEAMAQLGYLTYAFDFCGAGTRSQSDGATTDMSIITERDDLEAVIDYFKSRDDVDTNRICLMGDSQGGMVTALAAAHRPDEIERICLFYPALCIPDDWEEQFGSIDNVPATYPMGQVTLGSRYFTDAWGLIGRVYEEISNYKGKVLLVHGTDDTTVPISYSDRAASSEGYGSQCEYHIIQGAGHGFHGNDRRQSLTYTVRFMSK